MDARQFDAVARMLSAAGARRRVLAFLGGLPAARGLIGPPEAGDVAAKQRQRKHGKHE